MDIYHKYCFCGFDDAITELLATNFYSFLVESASMPGLSDYKITHDKPITRYRGIPINGKELAVKDANSIRSMKLMTGWFPCDVLSDVDSLIAALNSEKERVRLFFCFGHDYLEDGFDGLSSFSSLNEKPVIGNFLTHTLFNVLCSIQPVTLIHIDSREIDEATTIFRFQNEGKKLNGGRLAFSLLKNQAKDYRSFNYFLDKPVLILDNTKANYKSLLF